MKVSSSLLFPPKFLINIIFVLFLSPVSVNSQSSDSCNTTLNLNGRIPFDTTSFTCNSVWSSQSFIIRYKQTGSNQWSFVLSAPNSNRYIAMGFSPNGQMVGSSAIVGWVGTNGGAATMKRYFLGGQVPSQVQPDSGNLQVGNSSILSTTSLIYMAFQLNTAMPETRVLYAVGSPNQIPSPNGFRLSQHFDRISTSLNYATGESETQSSPYSRLKRSHGIVNLIGWAILMPIGAMVGRYMRQWDPVWFYSHTLIQSLGFILGIAGVVSGLVLNHRLDSDAIVKRHKAIGITVLVLGCLQAIAVLARPDKESKVRKYWNWYHHNGGRILIVLAIANVFYGVHLAKAGNKWNVGFGSAIGLFFLTSIILEIRLHLRK